MGTLVYSPGVRVLIDSTKHGIIDVSEDIMAGQVILNENTSHMLSLELENPRRKYDGLFMPNDRVVVRLKRLRWMQVFSGYLNTVPFASVWPRTVSLSASCTLKRLYYTFYDPGAIATTTLLTSFSNIQAGTSQDGNLSERAKAMLTQIGRWPKDAIHIARLPPDWWASIEDLYKKVSPKLSAATALVNPGAVISGVDISNLDADHDGVLTDEELLRLSIASNFPDPLTAAAVAWAESDGEIANRNSGSSARGLWQILMSAHPNYKEDKILSDPVYCAAAALKISSGGTNWTPWAVHPSSAFADPRGVARFNAAMERMRPIYERMNGQNVGSPGSASQAAHQGNGPNGDPALAPSGAIPAGVPSNIVFPVPGAGKPYEESGTGGVPWGYYDDWGNPRSGGRTHQGHDIFAAKGTPILSMTDGEVYKTNPTDSGLGGITCHIRDANGNTYYYAHCETLFVTVGQQVKAGQQIALVDNTGNAATTAAHCHFEYHPGGQKDAINPHALLNAAARVDVPSAGGATTGGPPMLGGSNYFPTPDELSVQLIGPRALLNDVNSPVINTVKDLLGASMRSFCSAPNGDLIAWFPDYFGNYGLSAKLTLEDIELLDFTINWSDERMVTHQFVTGTMMGYGAAQVDPTESVYQMVNTMGVATIDFPEILTAILGPDAGDWANPESILRRFGARPAHEQVPVLVTPEAEFFFAIYLFMRNWAQMFSASIPLSFMPELWPGTLLQIPTQGLQVYVEQVTHSWDMRDGGGFETRAQVCAPASLNGRFTDLPMAGGLMLNRPATP